MKRPAMLVLLVFPVLPFLTYAKEGSAQGGIDPAIARQIHNALVCPLGVRAEQTAAGNTLSIGDGRFTGQGQRLHVTLNNPKNTEIVGLRITAHGVTAKGRVLARDAANMESPDATRSLTLKVRVKAKEDVSTDIWLRGFTAIGPIDVDRVEYADGSSWEGSPSRSCRIDPDSLMLISRR
jgi:hypothetical protein